MGKKIVGGYISARETIAAAARNNQSVTDYVEEMWKIPGASARVVEKFREIGALGPGTQRVCEIGTGTGMFAEAVLKALGNCHYESYELDKEWAEWLSRTFKIVSQPTMGDNLSHTAPDSVDLIHANGVFVYTPLLITVRYFLELIRVTRRGGFAAFDILSERCLSGEALKYWLNSGETYPCILPEAYVKQFFLANGFSLAGEFFTGGFAVEWHYLVFRKR